MPTENQFEDPEENEMPDAAANTDVEPKPCDPARDPRDAKCTSRAIVGYWHYGVILTYAAVVLAIVGMIFAATKGRDGTGIAVVCLWFSGLCDSFDGMVAKTRKNRSDGDKSFGIQIDSLCDLISFGVAPVMIGVGLGMTEWYHLVIYCVYVLCALVRLAYFNVSEEQRTAKESGKRKSYEGMPVTQIALIMPVIYLVATMFLNWAEIVTFIIMTVVYVVYAVLMVVKIRLPKPGLVGLIIMIIVFNSTIVGLFLVRWFVVGIHML